MLNTCPLGRGGFHKCRKPKEECEGGGEGEGQVHTQQSQPERRNLKLPAKKTPAPAATAVPTPMEEDATTTPTKSTQKKDNEKGEDDGWCLPSFFPFLLSFPSDKFLLL